MQSDEEAYYRDRALKERQLAQEANTGDVAAIHEALAKEYEAVVESGSFPPPLRTESRPSAA